MKYTSAFARLNDLPEVFTGRDLALKFTWGQQMVSTYLSNWRKAELIRSLGGHSDVHLNLVASKQPNVDLAVQRVWPQAVRVGADVLREAGWTTQILSQPEIAVPADAPVFSLESFVVTTRTASWFAKVRKSCEQVHGGIPRLPAVWALADMIDRAMDGRIKSSWLLAPDDLDIEAAAKTPGLSQALGAFNLPQDLLTFDGYERLYDEFLAARATRLDAVRQRIEKG